MECVTKGSSCVDEMVSCEMTACTTESLVCMMNLHIWHAGSLHSFVFLLARSDGILAPPVRCCSLTWYQRMVGRNVVTLVLAENYP